LEGYKVIISNHDELYGLIWVIVDGTYRTSPKVPPRVIMFPSKWNGRMSV